MKSWVFPAVFHNEAEAKGIQRKEFTTYRQFYLEYEDRYYYCDYHHKPPMEFGAIAEDVLEALAMLECGETPPSTLAQSGLLVDSDSMQTYEFTIVLTGTGATEDAAWEDARDAALDSYKGTYMSATDVTAPENDSSKRTYEFTIKHVHNGMTEGQAREETGILFANGHDFTKIEAIQ